MANSFIAFSLGSSTIWDPTEGDQMLDTVAVSNALGTYGSTGTPLWESRLTWEPAGNGFEGGDPNEPSAERYDMDNILTDDQFSTDGGATVQTFDASMTFAATLSYKDGTSEEITAVVIQDTEGRIYWLPEFTDNDDQSKIESPAIVSLTLQEPLYAQDNFGQGYNLTASRTDSSPVCFTEGTMITTPQGRVAIEDLRVGSLVQTLDHGPQAIRWIGQRRVESVTLILNPKLRPVTIKAGALGPTMPSEDLSVSRQHRILMNSPVAARMFGSAETLIPACKLTSLPGVTIDNSLSAVVYYHLLFDAHEVIISNGAPTESLFVGKQAQKSLSSEALEEIRTLFPDLTSDLPVAMPARPFIIQKRRIEKFVERLMRNSKPAFEPM